jgi:hypothetical protein
MIDLVKEVLEDRISADYKKVLDLMEKENQLCPIPWERN